MIRNEFIQRDRSQHPPALTPDYRTSVLRSPRLALWSLQNSLSEVTGPVFGREELAQLDNDLLLNYAQTGEPIGERTIVHGRASQQPAGLAEFVERNPLFGGKESPTRLCV
jgi:protocatechuate 3,4-dioxygenase beta subunit